MSQISFDTEKGDEVVLGWDPPLQHFHLTVYDKNGEPTYCNIADDVWPGTLEEAKTAFTPTFAELGIIPPEGLWGLLITTALAEPTARFTWADDQWKRIA